MYFEKPIEMPRGSHFGSDYWITYSKKVQRTARFYSMLEYYTFVNLEMDYEVETFCEQPMKITDESSKTIPDFWVRYRNGTEAIIEVKHSTEVIRAEKSTETESRFRKQLRMQKEWCAKNHIEHRLITEKELFNDRFSAMNLDFLYHHNLRSSMFIATDKGLTEYLYDKPFVTIQELIDLKILPIGREYEILSYHYYKGIVKINIEKHPISKKSEVCLCQN